MKSLSDEPCLSNCMLSLSLLPCGDGEGSLIDLGADFGSGSPPSGSPRKNRRSDDFDADFGSGSQPSGSRRKTRRSDDFDADFGSGSPPSGSRRAKSGRDDFYINSKQKYLEIHGGCVPDIQIHICAHIDDV